MLIEKFKNFKVYWLLCCKKFCVNMYKDKEKCVLFFRNRRKCLVSLVFKKFGLWLVFGDGLLWYGYKKVRLI